MVRNSGCRKTGKAILDSSFFLPCLGALRLNKGKYWLGNITRGVTTAWTLLDSLGTSLEINESIFAGTYCHLQFPAKAKAWMAWHCGLVVWWWDNDSLSCSSKILCQLPLHIYRYYFSPSYSAQVSEFYFTGVSVRITFLDLGVNPYSDCLTQEPQTRPISKYCRGKNNSYCLLLTTEGTGSMNNIQDHRRSP